MQKETHILVMVIQIIPTIMQNNIDVPQKLKT